MYRNWDLSKSDFQNVLNVGRIDTGDGILFGVSKRRAVQTNKLTLIIGVGGSGKTALLKAFNILNQKAEKEYSKYVKFLIIDSACELNAISKKGIDTLSITTPMAQIRLAPENRSTFYKRFIPREFPVHCDRYSQYSRLMKKVMFYYQNSESSNDQLFREKIASYFTGDWKTYKDLPVDILVVSGIAGNTGSGMFIDVAVHARKACPIPANLSVYGFIMLPDTALKYTEDDMVKRRFYRNGFAALKELESYESIDMEAGRKELLPSCNPANNIELTAYNIPYNYPILISGEYDEAIGKISGAIVNSVANIRGPLYYSYIFSCSNKLRLNKIAKNAVSISGILRPDACPEDSHMYCSIGYAQASIPEKIVIPHIVGTVIRRLYKPAADASLGAAAKSVATAFCTREKSLSMQDYQNAMRELLGLTPIQQLNESSLWMKINTYMNKYCRVRDNNVEITFKEIVLGDTRQYIRGFGTIAAITDGSNKMQEAIRTEFKSLTEKAKGIMKKYGPRAMEYLYNGTGNPDNHGVKEDYSAFCLRTQIQFVRNRFVDQRPGTPPRKPDPPRGLIGKLYELFVKKEYDAWIQAARTCEAMNVRYGVARNMIEENGILQVSFVTPLEDFIWSASRFADVLETMGEYYEGVGKSLEEDNFRMFADLSGDNNGINLCQDEDTYMWVGERVNYKLANISIQGVKDALVDDFYNNSNAWTSNNVGVARKAFDEVMCRECALGKYAGNNNGMDLTITDYFEHVLSATDPAQQKLAIGKAVHEIVSQILIKSRPNLKVKKGTEPICKGMMILPMNLMAGESWHLISEAFYKELEKIEEPPINLLFSQRFDTIVYIQTFVANALSDISDLSLWEDAYEACLDCCTHLHNGEQVSLHMDTGYSQYNELTMEETAREKHVTESRPILPYYADRPDAKEWLNRIYGTGLSWMHYPSINVTRYGSGFDGQGGTKEAAYRSDLFREKIEEALRIGVIECVKEGNKYKYYINLIPREWTNLKIKGYKEKNKDGTFMRGKSLFEYLAKQNPQSNQQFRKQIFLRDSSFFSDAGFDFTDVINVWHWDPERVAREHKAYLMRMMRKSTGLFQDMEDTMWRLYPIEAELEGWGMKTYNPNVHKWKRFFDAYLYGLVNDENKTKWVGVVDDGGETEPIVRFSRRYMLDADEIVKKICADGLLLKLVYDEYEELRSEYDLSDDELDQIQEKITRNMTDDQLDDMIKERKNNLEAMYCIYKEKYGEKSDPVSAIMYEYGLKDCQIKEIESLVDFYKELNNVLLEYGDLF